MSAAVIERRRVLHLLGALIATAGLPATALRAAGGSHASALTADIDAEILHGLGAQYRKLAQGDAAEARIRTLLKDDSLSLDDALAQLRKLIAADFEHGLVIHLDGWFLSSTEGCLFAVSSELLSGQGSG